MKRLLWRMFLGLAWLAVGMLLAEMATYAWPLYRESSNAFMKARVENAPWPSAGSDSSLVATVAPADPTLLRQPSHEEQMAAHAIYLLGQNDASREMYTRVYKRSLLFGSGAAPDDLQAYGNLAAESIAGLRDIQAAAAAAAPFTIAGHPWRGWSCRASSTDPDGAGPLLSATVVLLRTESSAEGESTVALLQHPYNIPPEDSAYRHPFIDFKTHASLPDGKQFFGLPEFRLNNYGFRDDDTVVPRPPDVFRVACVGASTTFEGPTNGFTYPNLVERFLKERFPSRRIEVVNCGLSGINSEGEGSRFSDYLMLDPNVLIYYNAVNQICHSDLPHWKLNYPYRANALMRSRAAASFLGSLLGPSRDELREIFAERGQSNVFAMADAARRFGVTPILTTFCHPDGPNLSSEERVYYEHDARMNWVGRGFTLNTYLNAVGLWNDTLREECAARDIAMIDVAAQLTGGGQVFGDLCHMKDYGIEQKARVVAAGLEPYVEAFYAGTAPPAP